MKEGQGCATRWIKAKRRGDWSSYNARRGLVTTALIEGAVRNVVDDLKAVFS